MDLFVNGIEKVTLRFESLESTLRKSNILEVEVDARNRMLEVSESLRKLVRLVLNNVSSKNIL